MKIEFVIFLFFFGIFNHYAQQISGVIIDDVTKSPIEGASIYFDNTTIGTTSNSNGDFQLLYNESIKAPLVVSFLGYKKQIIFDYYNGIKLNISLVEDLNTLNEVVITREDSWSREYKLRVFKECFIGRSEMAKFCTIKNEDDIWLEFDEETLELIGSSKKPLNIENKKLKYNLSYDLQDFVVQFKRVSDTIYGKPVKHLRMATVKYIGTTLYEDLSSGNKKIYKRREKIYAGSVLHFMRALYSNKIEENGFKLYYEGRYTKPINFISIYKTTNEFSRAIRIFKPLTIVYKNNFENRSFVTPTSDLFDLDIFGNYNPIEALIFSGYMGNMRIADTLPLDYKP